MNVWVMLPLELEWTQILNYIIQTIKVIKESTYICLDILGIRIDWWIKI